MTERSHTTSNPASWDDAVGAWRDDATGELLSPHRYHCCRHCGRMPVPVAVVIPADISHTGHARMAVAQVDACIADIVRRLNAGATEPVTRGACCGHGVHEGEILLQDGRTLAVRNQCDSTD